MIQIKSEREIEKMRAVGRMAAECLEALVPRIKPGVTPLEIDRFCHDWTVARGAVPAPLNYKGFPKSLCISVNEVVCHGIPDNRPFKEGDIVNLDVTPKFDGYHGDTNITVLVGKVPEPVKKLVDVTYQALWKGIAAVKPGGSVGDIGHAIQQFIKPHGYGIVLEFCGHGIGKGFHEDPTISHVGRPGEGPKLKPGMTFTIEPMINLGSRHVYIEDDEWTVRTRDGKVSAQFEHTVLVTPTGVEVLTLRPSETPPFAL